MKSLYVVIHDSPLGYPLVYIIHIYTKKAVRNEDMVAHLDFLGCVQAKPEIPPCPINNSDSNFVISSVDSDCINS